MSQNVSIVKGHYRNEVISGVFKLLKPYTDGALGGYITIWNPHPKPNAPPTQRIKVEPGNFSIINDDGTEVAPIDASAITSTPGKIPTNINYEQEFVNTESDEDAMARISNSFEMLSKTTDACARGIVRGLVVSGPPGIGKSFGVEEKLKEVSMFNTIANKDPDYEIISGGISSIGLYQKLYFGRKPEKVTVFDDADEIFSSEESINLLKAALNSGSRRRICWNKESRTLNTEGIPDAFDFEGSVIFLSNIDFERSIERGSRISSHLSALMSRTHYLDLRIGSMRDKLLRIKQLCRDGMLAEYMFTAEQEADILAFIMNNSEYMREVSLRAVKKLADLVKMDPVNWYEYAEATLLVKEAMFKRLLSRKLEAAQQGLVLADV